MLANVDRSGTPGRGASRSLHHWALRNVVLPLSDLVLRHPMSRRLRELEAAQWWDRERLERSRDEALGRLLRVACSEVPFYRDLYDAAGVRPSDVRGSGDLARLPVVTKAMLRRGYPERTTRPTGRPTYEARTSGSTGTNFCVLEDSVTAGLYRASFLLALGWAGWRPGEPHVQTGMTLDRGRERSLKDWLLRCHYVSAYDLTDASLDVTLGELERRRIEHLWGYPGSIHRLARRAREVAWNLPLRSVVTWGDNLYGDYRRTIEAAFRTRVYDTYGCGEGMQIAAQCGASSAYHVHMLDVVVEYLDEEDRPVPPGRPGSVVVTRLHPGPMPLVRYRIGDVGTSGGRAACPCGRGLELLESVEGRETDVVITPSGNRLIVHFFTGILELFDEIDSFQVVQDEIESLTLRLKPGRGFSESVTERAVALLRERGARDVDIRVEVVDEIPLPPSGKRRFVVSAVGAARSRSGRGTRPAD